MEKNDKCRICRRAGEKLFLKGDKCNLPSCPVAKRPYPPGQTGAKGRMRKTSDYAKQLLEKQKARAIYGLTEKQMANYFTKARKKRHSTGEELLTLLETRADNVLYRSALASSRSEARQMVTHGAVSVNSKKIKSPSRQILLGDKLEVKAKLAKDTKREVAAWIKRAKDANTFEVTALPDVESIGLGVNIQLIIEYYSR